VIRANYRCSFNNSSNQNGCVVPCTYYYYIPASIYKTHSCRFSLLTGLHHAHISV